MDDLTTWELSPTEAIDIQKRLKERVRLTPLETPITLIAGCDVSMGLFAREGFAGFVSMTYPDLEPLTVSVVRSAIRFPYIPGLLSFREIPMLLAAWDGLPEKPDVLIVDGVGIAHPRRVGIASHLGLILDTPAIGCAKSVLVGTYEEPNEEPGAFSYLYDPKTTEIIGAAVRTKKGVRPVFISPGHLITLEESIEVVLAATRKHRLPEPTRMAHEAVNEYRRRR